MAALNRPSMLTQEEAVEMRVMARRGEGVRAIAKQLGCSRKPVRRCPREDEARRYGPQEPRACKLDPFKHFPRIASLGQADSLACYGVRGRAGACRRVQ